MSSSSSRNKYFLGCDLQQRCATLVPTHSNYSKRSTEQKKQQLERVDRSINNNYSYNSGSSNHHRGRSASKPRDSTSSSSTTRTATTATSAGATLVASSQGSSISASASVSARVDAYDLYEHEHKSGSQSSPSDCDHDVHDHHQQQQDPKSISALESLVRQPKSVQSIETKKKKTPTYANIEVVLDDDDDDDDKEEKTAAVGSNPTSFALRRSFYRKDKKKKSATNIDSRPKNNQQQRHTHSLTNVTITSSKSGSASSTIARLKMLNCFAAAGGRQQLRQDGYGYQDFNCSDSDAYGEGNSLAASNVMAVSSADSPGRRTTTISRSTSRGRTTRNNDLLTNPLEEEDKTEEIDTNDESTTSTAYHEEFLKLSVTDIEEELERRDTLINLPEQSPFLKQRRDEAEYCHSQHQNQSVSPPQQTREEKSSASPSGHDMLLTTHVEIPSKEESPVDKQRSQGRYKMAAPSFLRR
eukprot:CAMPEP_0168274256 /NCGR_PEP_ID=MMETSP0141_2-20121125/17192_1 /TAXON_ID=44445 /ORGANISM="Pseudo-nitzschia australis, Strain 10249 10 AB" /LENGTH=469 /DNA_ID=CAMNT_0008215813 /DNA_START=47 /DNA_END=1452 /DNA_ORIENTATION=-